MSEQNIALVTGASSGFGLLTAKKLVEAGYRVLGTSRSPGPETPSGFEMLELEVASTASVTACVNGVLERCGRIDLLVNNAGRGHRSLLEETSMQDAASVFETNFWGVVRVTNAVLPAMRARKSGLIINVSSLAGLVGAPGQGFYAASKHALEAYTETLRVELSHLPVEVSMVEPGFFRTGFRNAMIPPGPPIDDYDAIRPIVESKIEEGFSAAGDPEIVADAILSIARRGGEKMRHRIGEDAKRISRMKKWIPERLFMSGMLRNFGLDQTD
ncbi:MAG: SDR family NAD(P)-dependent oxidoreductase [Verrucomicrobiales bacterium]